MEAKIKLGDYIKKKIIIPCYQRGYIWGKEHNNRSLNSIEYMLNSIRDSFKKEKELFIQGITVVESGDSYEVIDGQQRSTFFYLLLKFLGDKAFKIEYNSSRGSNTLSESSPQKWLDNVTPNSNVNENEDEEFQDVYYFKKTCRLIKEHDLMAVKAELCKYLKENVSFLIIPISEDIAVSTFTMMNGNKAEMEDFELIKADLLRRASLGNGGYENAASEWDNVSLRSRYAHEWDKWLYWWNRKDVQLMYNCSNPMGLLLHCVFHSDKLGLFESYKTYIIENSAGKGDAQKAKLLFAKLIRVQNRFENAFSNPCIYNQFGIITRLIGKEHKISFINDYFNSSEKPDLKLIYEELLFGMTYLEIRGKDKKKYREKKERMKQDLIVDPIYGNNNELAYRYLLVRNVEADSGLERKFDFGIWENRSLEHIFPKSKVVHKDEDGQWVNGSNMKTDFLEESSSEYIKREKIFQCAQTIEELQKCEVTEHSIGNLLLLYKNDNSAHGNKDVEDKLKEDFFNPQKELFKSRNLLHTIEVFARDGKFDALAICENQKEVVEDLSKRMEELDNYFEIKED